MSSHRVSNKHGSTLDMCLSVRYANITSNVLSLALSRRRRFVVRLDGVALGEYRVARFVPRMKRIDIERTD